MICTQTLMRYEQLMRASNLSLEERKDVLYQLALDMNPTQTYQAALKVAEDVLNDKKMK